MRVSKFVRDKNLWRLGGVDQPLDLRQLLSNLGTYAIHETKGLRRTGGKHTLVVPLRQTDFVHLFAALSERRCGGRSAGVVAALPRLR